MKRTPDLTSLFQEAAEAWRGQDYQRTIDLLEKAAELAQANAGILLDLARAYGLRYNFPAAERCLEKAVRLQPKSPALLAEAGRRCQEFGHYELATRFFERAVQQKAPAPDVVVTLAELYERRHRLEEAAVLINEALRRNKDYPRALLIEARLKRLTGENTESERVVRSLLARPAGDESTRIAAWYELAATLDRTGRYDEAMAALLEAKSMQTPAARGFAPTLRTIQARVQEMQQTITEPVLDRWRQAAGDLPEFSRLAVLCGHPRSGTTLLEQMLDAHPQIVSSEETHILHDEAYLPLTRGFRQDASILEVLDSAPPTLLAQARVNYFRSTELFIRQTLGHKLLVDKNPALNVLIPAVIRIFPEARFLVALRDPRDVVLSCFMQPLALNPVSSAYLTLESTVAQYLSVMGFWRHLLGKMKDHWLEIRYEDLVQDPEIVMKRTLAFLELEWDDNVLQFHERARLKPIRSPSYHDVAKPIYAGAVGRWIHYRKHLEPYLEKLNPLLKALGYE